MMEGFGRTLEYNEVLGSRPSKQIHGLSVRHHVEDVGRRFKLLPIDAHVLLHWFP